MLSILVMVCDTAFSDGIVNIHYGWYVATLIIDIAANSGRIERMKELSNRAGLGG